MRQEKQDCLQHWENKKDDVECLRLTREIRLQENERIKSLGILANRFTEVVALTVINDGKQETAQVKRWDFAVFSGGAVRPSLRPSVVPYNLWIKRDSFVAGLSNTYLTASWSVNHPTSQRAERTHEMSFGTKSVIHTVEVSADGRLFIIPRSDVNTNLNYAIEMSNDLKESNVPIPCGSGQCQAFFARPDDRYVCLNSVYASPGRGQKKELYNLVSSTCIKIFPDGIMNDDMGGVRLDSKSVVDRATLIDDRKAPATTTPLLCWSSQSEDDKPIVHYVKFYDDEKNDPQTFQCMVQLTGDAAIAQIVSNQGMISIFLVNGTVYLAQHDSFERGVKALVAQEKKTCFSMDLLVKQGFFGKRQLAGVGVTAVPEVRAAQDDRPAFCALQ